MKEVFGNVLIVLLILIGVTAIGFVILDKEEIFFGPGERSAGKIYSDGDLSLREAVSNKIVSGRGLETNREDGKDFRFDEEVRRGEELLVKFKQDVSEVKINSILNQEGIIQVGLIEQIEVRIIKINSEDLDINARKELIDTKVTSLSINSDVKFVEKNQYVRPAMVPNDEFLDYQWHLEITGLIQAWDLEIGNSEVLIATGDTGIDSDHEDIAGRYIVGWNYDGENNDIEDVLGHGTNTFGVLGALTNNGLGVAGTTWDNSILVDKITDDIFGVSPFSITAESIVKASDLGARVYSLSFDNSWDSSAIIEAANYFRANGGLVFAATGNEAKFYDIEDIPEIIHVGATDMIDNLAHYSNTGPFVDLVAPGGDLDADLDGDGFGDGILTTEIGGTYYYHPGTSYSVPIVAGVAALMFSADPNLTPEEVEQILKETAVDLGDPGFDNEFGWGRVNALAAIELVAITECVEQCSASDPTACYGQAVWSCGNFDSDPCFEWGLELCEIGEICYDGECTEDISCGSDSDCPSNQPICRGDGLCAECFNLDDCLGAEACEGSPCQCISNICSPCIGERCISGGGSCFDECEIGESECTTESGLWVCGESGDGDDCLDRVYDICAEGDVCDVGECIDSCTETCEDRVWECGGYVCGEYCGSCLADATCINHQCVACTDTDGGTNVYLQGTATNDENTETDYCQDSEILVEYKCQSNEEIDFILRNCADLTGGFGGWECEEGACVTTGNCEYESGGYCMCDDNDGGANFELAGTTAIFNPATEGSQLFDDWCSSNTLLEYYCDGAEVGSMTRNCIDFYGQDWDCIEGQCEYVGCGLLWAEWETHLSSVGQVVELTVQGDQYCWGKSLEFDVLEYDSSGEDDNANLNPVTVVFEPFQNWQVTSQWIVENPGDEDGDPEFYFVAGVVNEDISISSGTLEGDLLHVVPIGCPNGVHEAQTGEQCDDGNDEDNDGCAPGCILEYCGDGIVQDGIGEECDPPGPIDSESTCTPRCQIQEIFSFLPGTKVTMSDESLKNIEEIKIGDVVLGYNEFSEGLEPSKVLYTRNHKAEGYYVINERLRVTGTNPIYVNGEWKKPVEILEGDRLVGDSGKEEFVSDIYYVVEDVHVYNLQIENTQTYFADGILVHNKVKGCEQCGEGFFSICNEKKCESIGQQCEFQNNPIWFGGSCSPGRVEG